MATSPRTAKVLGHILVNLQQRWRKERRISRPLISSRAISGKSKDLTDGRRLPSVEEVHRDRVRHGTRMILSAPFNMMPVVHGEVDFVFVLDQMSKISHGGEVLM